jgi:hypothetical protein
MDTACEPPACCEEMTAPVPASYCYSGSFIRIHVCRNREYVVLAPAVMVHTIGIRTCRWRVVAVGHQG